MEIMRAKTGYLLFKLCLGLIMYFTKSSLGQHVEINHYTILSNDTGPVVTIECVSTFPQNSTGHIVKLSLDSIMLAENGNPTVSPPRYNYEYFYDSVNTMLQLNIKNAIKQDEGLYQCEIQYHLHGSMTTPSLIINTNETNVVIEQYLPAPNFPVCELQPPGTVLFEGSLTTFSCNAGDSNPHVKLELQLTGTSLGKNIASFEFVANERYNNTKLACTMTSDTFPTANRACYVGPLQVLQAPPTTTGDSNTTPLQQFTSGMTTLRISSASPSTSAGPSIITWIIIGGSAAGVLILIILIIIICVLFKKVSNVEKSTRDIQLQSVDADGYSQVHLQKNKSKKAHSVKMNGYVNQPKKSKQSQEDNPYAEVQDVEPSVGTLSNSKSTFDPTPPPVPSTRHPSINISSSKISNSEKNLDPDPPTSTDPSASLDPNLSTSHDLDPPTSKDPDLSTSPDPDPSLVLDKSPSGSPGPPKPPRGHSQDEESESEENGTDSENEMHNNNTTPANPNKGSHIPASDDVNNSNNSWKENETVRSADSEKGVEVSQNEINENLDDSTSINSIEHPTGNPTSKFPVYSKVNRKSKTDKSLYKPEDTIEENITKSSSSDQTITLSDGYASIK